MVLSAIFFSTIQNLEQSSKKSIEMLAILITLKYGQIHLDFNSQPENLTIQP
jgi:hypothetical protein